MNALKHIRTYLLVCSLVVILQPLQGLAQQNSDASRQAFNAPPRNGMGNAILTSIMVL